MTTLIPDARRGLLGGLVDDASLLGAARDVGRAVEAYRMRRDGTHGWMVGRLVVPASLLEDLAGVLVRTMKAGDSPMPVVVVFDGPIAADASKASAFHATMDPAARIDIVRFAAEGRQTVDTVVEAAKATRGIHHDVLPMMTVSLAENATPAVAAITAAQGTVLCSVGATVDVPPATADVSHLASWIRACLAATVPLTIHAEWFPTTTLIDRPTGRISVGAVNLLAAILQAEGAADETVSILSNDQPDAITISFGGLVRSGKVIRTDRSIGTDRSPLISLSVLDPTATLEALGGLDRAG